MQHFDVIQQNLALTLLLLLGGLAWSFCKICYHH